MKVSACFIVKNEERNLPIAIKSIKEIVDELIVVDTGSDDQTIEIAKKFGAKIYNYKWQDDFSAARNFAIDKSAADWVIFLDADEYFSIKASGLLREYMKQYFYDQVDALGCKMVDVDIHLNQETGGFPCVRIFKNRADIRYTGKIHEHIVGSKQKLKLIMLPEDIIIYHTGYSSEIVEAKLIRNLKMIKEEMLEKGENILHYRYLCDCYHSLKQWKECYESGKKYILFDREKDILGIKTNIYIKVLYALQQITDNKERICNEIKQAIEIYPNHPEFYMQYADFLLQNKNKDEALSYYLLAINCSEKIKEQSYTDNFSMYKFICYNKAAELLYEKKEIELALQYYTKSLKSNKYNKKAVYGIINSLDDSAAIIMVFNDVYDIKNYQDMDFLVQALLTTDNIGLVKYYMQYFFINNIGNDTYNNQNDTVNKLNLDKSEKKKEAIKNILKYFMERKVDLQSVQMLKENLLLQDIDAELLCMLSTIYLNYSMLEDALQLSNMAIVSDKAYLNAYIVAAKICFLLGDYMASIKNCCLVYELGQCNINDNQLQLTKCYFRDSCEKIGIYDNIKLIDYIINENKKIIEILDKDSIYNEAVNFYNRKEGIKAALYLEILTSQVPNSRYCFLAGLNYFMNCLRTEFMDKIIECLTSYSLDDCELSKEECLKTAEMLRTVYWEIGAAQQAYAYAFKAVALSETIEKKRFNFSTGLFIANRLTSLTDEELYELHNQYQNFISDIAPFKAVFYKHSKLRIGYISPDLRHHAVANFTMPLLENYSRSQFEVYCYARCREDEISERIKKNVNKWCNIQHFSDKEIAALIRNDEIDILVELAGHTADNSLAVMAYRPAPLQLCGIGYINTTGLAAIDYFITDKYCTGAMQKKFFVEIPYILPQTHFCYNEITPMPECCHKPVDDKRSIIFASFNKASKITDEVLQNWSLILTAVPDSKLILKCMEFIYECSRQRMTDKLQQAGISIDRVILQKPSANYLNCYNDVDIVLDTYPCGGGTTSFEALYMGVPVITLVGNRHVSRFGYSILKNLGLDELIAENPSDYVSKAITLAGDSNRLNKLHINLRNIIKCSPLMDTANYTNSIENMYKNIYKTQLEYNVVPVTDKLQDSKVFYKGAAAKMLSMDESTIEAQFLQASHDMKLQNFESALKKFKNILNKDDSLVGVYVKIAHIYEIQQRYISMRDTLNTALEKVKSGDSYEEEIYYLLGTVNTLLGKPVLAADNFYKASQCAAEISYARREFSNYLFVSNYCESLSQQDLYQRHLEYNKFFANVQPYEHVFRCNDRIRVGYLSSDFGNHVVGYFLQQFMRFANKEKFEVFCYHDSGNVNDEVTILFKKMTKRWRDIKGMTDADAAALIVQDRIDILVDLGGHTANSRLSVLAYRAAPVQLSGVGYFHSTGLKYVDYFLGDIYCDSKENNEKYFTEKVLKLPHSHWCYLPFKFIPNIVPELPCRKNEYITFCSFNNFNKVSDSVLKVWGQIMNRIPNSKLLLKSKIFSSDEGLHYMQNRFKKLKLPLKRIEFRAASMSYLEEYNEADIALDTFPYTGGATTCEALYMGLPVISLAGCRHGSRFGVSILSNIGCPELVARTCSEYIKKAVELAHDKKRLQQYRNSLRTAMLKSPLMNAKLYMWELEEKYEEIFATWQAEKIKMAVKETERLIQIGKYTKAFSMCLEISNYIDKYGNLEQKAIVSHRKADLARILGDVQVSIEAYKNAADYTNNLLDKVQRYESLLLCLHYQRQKRDFVADMHKAYQLIQPDKTGSFLYNTHRLGKIRIGYISADFRRQVMLNFIRPFLEDYDRQDFEVYCYMTGAEDNYSDALKKQVDKWHNLRGINPGEIARQINSDEIDILVDFNGHSAGSNMAVLAYKPAPVQISGLGYVDLLGLSYIDYIWADPVVYKEADEQLFGDNMIILPDSMFCFKPFARAALPKQFAFVKNDFITFGSFNHIAKITDEVLSVWSRIFQALPDCKLLLKADAFADAEFCAEYTQRLASFGITRAELRPTSSEYLSEYADVDIALDTFPYNGGGTTCDALYMGVPVVTLVGNDYGSNYGASLMTAAGLKEFIAESHDKYVDLAVALAGDTELLYDLKQNLRLLIKQSPLMNTNNYMRNIEAAYRQIYQR